MQINHHVGYYFDAQSRDELAQYGIRVSLGIDAFDIEETNPHWQKIETWIKEKCPVVTVTTQFNRDELRSALYLHVAPIWHHGYPMSDLDNGYIDLTYDTSDGCAACGIGWRQKSPFRIKAEPKWGARNILELNWVFDEYFVKPEVYSEVFKPFGIACREVLHYKTDKPLCSVVQLVIDSVSKYSLDIQPLNDELCNQCLQGKFNPRFRGYFPKLLGGAPNCIFKSKEYFGSGASAWRAVIVSNEVYQAMTSYGVKGVTYYPLAT